MRNMRGIMLAVLIGIAPLTAMAQFMPSDTGTDLNITMNPQNPAPGVLVTLSAQSTSIDLSQASITWVANGKTILDGVGEQEAQLTAGALGSATTVTVHATLGSQSADSSITVMPETVDLLADAASYVPPFYRGRSLASAGSTLRLQAIPHIITPSGAIAARELTYTWRQDGETLGSLSGRGKSTITLPAPPLFGSSVISVTAQSADGTYSAERAIRIGSVDPDITLYLDHPLFGTEYYRAIPDTGSVDDLQATLVGVPYFVAAVSPKDPRLSWSWAINDTPLAASSTAANTVSLDAKGIQGSVLMALSLTSSSNFSLSAEHSWHLRFGVSPTAQRASNTPHSQ